MSPKKQKDRFELVYKLDGELKEIDVFKLAPALTGIGEMIQAAHVQLGVEHGVGVNVKPFGSGSFVVEISLLVKHNLPILGAMGLAGIGAALSQTKRVLEGLGVIKSEVEGVIGAIKKLGGKPEHVEQIAPNQFQYQARERGTIVNGDVHQLMQNPTIQKAVIYVISKLMEQDGVTGVETFERGKEAQTKVLVRKSEAHAFQEFGSSVIPSPVPIEERVSEPVTYYLKPKRGSFEGEPDNWSFRVGANATMRIDVIRDEAFLEKVKTGIHRLSPLDLVIAEVVHRQKVSGNELIGDVRYELIRVIDYQEAPHQPSLFGDINEKKS
jgi:L-fucose mutarotase/ribose pyranase (RbsD/FucU family)